MNWKKEMRQFIILLFFLSGLSVISQTLDPEDSAGVPMMRGRPGLIGILMADDEVLVLRARRSKDHLYIQPPPSGFYLYTSPSQQIGPELNKFRVFPSGNALVRLQCDERETTRFMGEDSDVLYLDLQQGKAIMRDGRSCDLLDGICPGSGEKNGCMLELKVLAEEAEEDGFGGTIRGKKTRIARIFDLSSARAVFSMTVDSEVLEAFGYNEAVPDKTYPFIFRLVR